MRVERHTHQGQKLQSTHILAFMEKEHGCFNKVKPWVHLVNWLVWVLIIFKTVSFSTGWSQPFYVGRNDLEILIFLPSSPKCWDKRCTPPTKAKSFINNVEVKRKVRSLKGIELLRRVEGRGEMIPLNRESKNTRVPFWFYVSFSLA